MAVQSPVRLTVEEYLAWEETNFEKHEYIDGEVRCMAGASRRHNEIAMNIGGVLWFQLGGSNCKVMGSEMRARVGATRYVYPDITVYCDKPQFENNSETELLNPVMVAEVTSPSSMEIDWIEKREVYLDVESIQLYLIIDQHRVGVELCARTDDGWRTATYTDLSDVVELGALDCKLPLADVYRGITFEPPPS